MATYTKVNGKATVKLDANFEWTNFEPGRWTKRVDRSA
jgi:hypothetical protein